HLVAAITIDVDGAGVSDRHGWEPVDGWTGVLAGDESAVLDDIGSAGRETLPHAIQRGRRDETWRTHVARPCPRREQNPRAPVDPIDRPCFWRQGAGRRIEGPRLPADLEAGLVIEVARRQLRRRADLPQIEALEAVLPLRTSHLARPRARGHRARTFGAVRPGLASGGLLLPGAA